MWKEILWVKPKVDAGDAKRMERTLSQRFATATQRFGVGLKAILKGSLFGLSVGLVSKLLNPLEELTDRIKSLMEEGSNLTNLADEFNTDPGKIKRLQDVGKSLGLAPDKLQELMTKYAKAVEDGRDALAKGETLSDASKSVQNFLGQQDLAEGFFSFINNLKNDPNRTQAEQNVFGGRLHGPEKKFVNANFPAAFAAINEPGVDQINAAVNNAANASDVQARLSTENETKAFVSDSKRPLSNYVKTLEAAANAKAERLSANFNQFEALRKAADEIQGVKNGLETLNNNLLDGIGQIRGLKNDLKETLPKMTKELGKAGDRGPKF
jgi:uncharacterized phage infection (PIP) family protein YhgE